MGTRQEDETAIHEIEGAARKAAEARDLERYISFYADDAALFWPGAPRVAGKAAIREWMRAFFAMPRFSLSFQTAGVQVSRGGDLAFSYGTNAVSFTDRDGRTVNDRGKYLTFYRKEPGGGWKVVADMGNSDLPAPVPAE